MFLNSPDQIPDIILANQFTIFGFPKNSEFPLIPKAINISPNEKNVIPVEEIHNIEELVRTKQLQDLTIILNSAESMTEQAQNCFLKLLEEPGINIHFVFFSHSPQNLLSTVRSRAHNYIFKSIAKIDSPPKQSQKTIDLAKQYISASPKQLVDLSATLAKDRQKTLLVLDAAIELLYKSYFKTKNPKFLDKLERLLKTHDNISKNGHVRLQLVAGAI